MKSGFGRNRHLSPGWLHEEYAQPSCLHSWSDCFVAYRVSIESDECQTKAIGLMGCGAVAAYGHVPAIQQTPGLLLHAIFDPNSDAVKSMQETFGIPHAFTDSTAFFESGLRLLASPPLRLAIKGNALDAAPISFRSTREAACHE